MEEVDILRHLSSHPNDNVIHFVDAWEQVCEIRIEHRLPEILISGVAESTIIHPDGLIPWDSRLLLGRVRSTF